MNMVPKEGGNGFRFSVDGMFTNSNLQSSNLTDDLRERGLTECRRSIGCTTPA